MSDLISRSELLEELSNYEKELRKDKTEAIETDDEQMLFAITNQETAICRIRRNVLHMPTAYNVEKVVEELEKASFFDTYNSEETKVIDRDKAIGIVKQGGVYDDVCEWKLEDEEANLYVTGCEQRQLIFEGTPKENGYRYCPYCSKKIKIKVVE